MNIFGRNKDLIALSLSVFSIWLFLSVPLSAFGQTIDPRIAKAEKFEIKVSEQKLEEIKSRVRNYNLPATSLGDAGWKYGMDRNYLKKLVIFWRDRYDWRRAEDNINRFQHFRASIDDLKIHFFYEKGSGKNPQPLLLLHGFPYSSLSFLDLIEPLAHPERFGGNADDGFDVIVPDLPGYGFSDAPRTLQGLRFSAEIIRRLMTEVLGYRKFIVQGGDFGDVAGIWMAFDHPENILGLHENLLDFRDSEAAYNAQKIGQSLSSAEKAFLVRERENFQKESAYNLLQSTRSQTLAAALSDSPVGQAAWIIEKFYYWSDKTRKNFDSIYATDHLLDEAMYYIVTDSFESALRPYVAMASIEREKGVLPVGKKITVPVAFAVFPNDSLMPIPPKSLMHRSRALIAQWTEMPRGGHFPMLEEPALLIEDIRKFGRLLKARIKPSEKGSTKAQVEEFGRNIQH